MPSMVQLKRRIKTAQNISKTTRALNMIATSKLKRAQDATILSRPYSDKLLEVARSISHNVAPGDRISYLKETNSKKDLYIVISPDKGLCGNLIPNLVRAFGKQVSDKNADLITVGKKIEPYAARSKKMILASFPFGNTLPSFSAVYPIVEFIDEHFLKGNINNVYILTTRFHNVFSQAPDVIHLLPIKLPEASIVSKLEAVELFEPSAEEILPALLRRYIETTIYHAMLESYASFQAAQMTAMKNATDNAKEIIEDLKLVYNKTRQERITSELLDISSSAFITA